MITLEACQSGAISDHVAQLSGLGTPHRKRLLCQSACCMCMFSASKWCFLNVSDTRSSWLPGKNSSLSFHPTSATNTYRITLKLYMKFANASAHFNRSTPVMRSAALRLLRTTFLHTEEDGCSHSTIKHTPPHI